MTQLPLSYETIEKIRDVFNKLADREVQVIEIKNQKYQRYGIDIPRVEVSPSDEVIAELRNAVEAMGLTLHVRVQPQPYGGRGPNSVDAAIYKDQDDGKYRLSYSFGI